MVAFPLYKNVLANDTPVLMANATYATFDCFLSPNPLLLEWSFINPNTSYPCAQTLVFKNTVPLTAIQQVQLPNAIYSGTPQTLLIKNQTNLSLNLSDGLGNSIATLLVNQVYLVFLLSNETVQGSWSVFQLGATAAPINIGALAGNGLQTNTQGTQLEVNPAQIAGHGLQQVEVQNIKKLAVKPSEFAGRGLVAENDDTILSVRCGKGLSINENDESLQVSGGAILIENATRYQVLADRAQTLLFDNGTVDQTYICLSSLELKNGFFWTVINGSTHNVIIQTNDGDFINGETYTKVTLGPVQNNSFQSGVFVADGNKTLLYSGQGTFSV